MLTFVRLTRFGVFVAHSLVKYVNYFHVDNLHISYLENHVRKGKKLQREYEFALCYSI
jgi:hypothetical protein